MTDQLHPGDRIRLLSMHCDPDPILAGTTGTVRSLTRHGCGTGVWYQIDVDWDSGRTLMLVVPPDQYEILGSQQPERS